MDQNIKRLGALGLQVSFTEIDLAMALPGDEIKYKIQALSYGNLLKLALNNPSIIKSFLSWGFTDKHSWIPNFKPGFGDALIFNTLYAPKYAYNQMSNLLEFNCAATESKGAYTGTPINIAGTIEAENYDKGGEGISFHDAETANLGASYRTDAVDIAGTSTGGNTVGWTATGEWLEYTINVTKTSVYNFNFITSSPSGTGVISLTADGNPLLSNITVPSTADWNTYTSFSKTVIPATQPSPLLPMHSVKAARLYLLLMPVHRTNGSTVQRRLESLQALRQLLQVPIP